MAASRTISDRAMQTVMRLVPENKGFLGPDPARQMPCVAETAQYGPKALEGLAIEFASFHLLSGVCNHISVCNHT